MHPINKKWPVAAVLLAAALFVTACSRLVGGIHESLTSDADLARQAAETHKEIIDNIPLYDHAGLAAYIDRVGQRVARAADPSGKGYHFYLLDTDDTNAFSIPGGYIYINRGMLALLNSEDELAVTLGHELGHVIAKHSAARSRAHGGSSIVGPLIQAGSVVAAVLLLNPLPLVGLFAAEKRPATCSPMR